MTRAGENGRAGPLAGVRVVEISYQAGAVAGRILADLGAEVIKIEPDGGEASRMAEPCATLPDGGRISYYWLGFNVSKRSMSSEEHTSELQSLMRISYAVFCLKKKILIIFIIDRTDNNLNSLNTYAARFHFSSCKPHI